MDDPRAAVRQAGRLAEVVEEAEGSFEAEAQLEAVAADAPEEDASRSMLFSTIPTMRSTTVTRQSSLLNACRKARAKESLHSEGQRSHQLQDPAMKKLSASIVSKVMLATLDVVQMLRIVGSCAIRATGGWSRSGADTQCKLGHGWLSVLSTHSSATGFEGS